MEARIDMFANFADFVNFAISPDTGEPDVGSTH
jgi:hypothetical protein